MRSRRTESRRDAWPLVGRSYEQLLDAWIGDIAFENEDTRARFRDSRLAQQNHAEPTTADLRMRDGRTLRVIDRRTADGGIVKTIWDLTDDVRLAEDVREARGAAETASRAKIDFLSSMSHELRTPMNAILGFAQLLQRDKEEPLSARHAERVDLIVKGGEHLVRLIDDVLHEVATTLESMAARHGIVIEVASVPEPLPSVAADRTRFVQILTNFGSNAIKCNLPAGKVTLSAATTHAERVRIVVADTGRGIAAESQVQARSSGSICPFMSARRRTPRPRRRVMRRNHACSAKDARSSSTSRTTTRTSSW